MLPPEATDQGSLARKHKAAPTWACLGLACNSAFENLVGFSGLCVAAKRYAKFGLSKELTSFYAVTRNSQRNFWKILNPSFAAVRTLFVQPLRSTILDSDAGNHVSVVCATSVFGSSRHLAMPPGVFISTSSEAI